MDKVKKKILIRCLVLFSFLFSYSNFTAFIHKNSPVWLAKLLEFPVSLIIILAPFICFVVPVLFERWIEKEVKKANPNLYTSPFYKHKERDLIENLVRFTFFCILGTMALSITAYIAMRHPTPYYIKNILAEDD